MFNNFNLVIMKKKIFLMFVFVAATALAGYHSTVKNDKMSLLDYSLASLESLAGCEVSPNHSDNVGYCSKQLGSSAGACVESGSGAEPRCSGNY